jgi:hypothetical protein
MIALSCVDLFQAVAGIFIETIIQKIRDKGVTAVGTHL